MGIQNDAVKKEIKVFKQSSNLKEIALKFQQENGRKPIGGVDLSGWIMAGILSSGNQRVIEQFHSVPPQPVSAVTDYVLARVNVFQSMGWYLLLVLDGQRNPLKAATNEKRKGSLEEDKERLRSALLNPIANTPRRVDNLRKKTMFPRNDVYGEVIWHLKDKGIPVFGAPFETDHQMVALQHQGMIDFVISKDTDMPFLGIARTIYNFNATSGRCDLLELYGPKGLMEKLLLTFLLRGATFREKSYQETLKCLPCNIFSVAAQNVPVHFAYPRIGSNEAREALSIGRKRALRDINCNLFDSEDSDSDELYPEDSDSDGTCSELGSASEYDSEEDSEFELDDATDSDEYYDWYEDYDWDDNDDSEDRIDLCKQMTDFAGAIMSSMNERNIAHHMSVDRIASSACSSARRERNQLDIARQNIRLQRLHYSVKVRRGFYPNMLSFYAQDFVARNKEHEGDFDKMPEYVIFDDGIKLSDYINALESDTSDSE